MEEGKEDERMEYVGWGNQKRDKESGPPCEKGNNYDWRSNEIPAKAGGYGYGYNKSSVSKSASSNQDTWQSWPTDYKWPAAKQADDRRLKSKMCRNLPNCRFGERCKFAHSDEELKKVVRNRG